MTEMGIKYLNYLEDRRSNLAKEVETHRANTASETETHRSNVAREVENNRANLAKEQETHRSNLAKEIETNRSNLAKEANTRYDISIDSVDNELKAVKTELSSVYKQMDATAAAYADTYRQYMQPRGNGLTATAVSFAHAITSIFKQDEAKKIFDNSAYYQELERYAQLLAREQELEEKKSNLMKGK